MAEVFTETLSANDYSSDSRTIHRKYVHASFNGRELRRDFDDLISDASETLLDQLSTMSLECTDEDQFARPSADKSWQGCKE